MAIKILYVDIRDDKQVMDAYLVSWRSGMSAKQAVQDALKEDVSGKIIHDLDSNNPEIIIAWHDERIEEHSEMGGVGGLDWEIPDKSVLTIVYENKDTTEQQVDLSSDWMNQNSAGE